MKDISNQKITFRNAAPKDIPDMLNLWRKSMRKDYNLDGASLEKMSQNLEQLFDVEIASNVWVAIDENENNIKAWQGLFPIFQTPLSRMNTTELLSCSSVELMAEEVESKLMQLVVKSIGPDIKIIYTFINKFSLGKASALRKIGFLEIGSIPVIPSVTPFFFERILYVYITN